MSKKKRVGFKLDMTPMVDVGFLLLTFFMLSTTFKPQDVAEVTIPQSHSAIKLPDINLITITVDKDGGVYFGVDNQNIREALLGAQNKFKAGVAVQISELPNLLKNARMRNFKLQLVIKADNQSEYKVVQSVMDVLQKVNITRFMLLTDLEK